MATSATGATVSSTVDVWLHVDFEDGSGQDFQNTQDVQNYIDTVMGNINDLPKAALLAHWLSNDPTLNNQALFVGKTCTVDPANIGTITSD